MPEMSIVLERDYDAPVELVWALLADSNRFDRAMGFSMPAYRWQEIDGRRQHVARGLQAGIMVEWIEPPYQWIEGRMMSGFRKYIRGPLGSGGMRIDVTPSGAGTRARVRVFGESPRWYMGLMKPIVRRQLRTGVRRYMDAVEETLRQHRAAVEGPPVLAVHGMLEASAASDASGPIGAIDRAELARRGARLREVGLDRDIVERLIEMLSARPDEEVAQIQPFERAKVWRLDRREVLRVFLHATRAGLLDLNWQVNCPVCRVAAAVAPTMAEIGRRLHCEACNIHYDVDLAANVEAVFRCSPAIRDVQPAVFCAASPSMRPHVVVQLAIPAHGEIREGLRLHDGRLHMRTLGMQRPADLVDPTVPARIEIVMHPDRIEARTEGTSSDHTTELHVRSLLDGEGYLVVERGAWSADVVLGTVVASLPEFVELFATEAPAAGLELSIGRLALLFSDLTGSTALYERVGDAKAFAIVQDHFRRMEAIVTAHAGAVVKTMGDAVMASFSRTSEAIAAAIEMVAETSRAHDEHGIGVKIGVHEGPCLAVRANDRLDFFGTTVNIAARLQAQARTGELVVLRELVESHRDDASLTGFAARSFRVGLKGISTEQDLVGFDLRSARDRTPRASGTR